VYERLLARRFAASKRSVLILGPRQVGKSTLLESLKPDFHVNLAHPATFRQYVARPERFADELRAAPGAQLVFIDEVQRVPALLVLVQVLIDEGRDRRRFLLSGSSARKLRRGQANLLPGRAHVHSLHPLLARELGSDFDLDRALAHGTLPGIYAEPDSQIRAQDLRSYTDTYLREEIQAEALVRNLGGYARLLELVAASSGKILNVNSLCSDAGVGYETARRYLTVIEDTLVAFRIPAWSGSDRMQLVNHPKLYLFDLGVRNALLRRPLDAPLIDERGLLLEHFIAYELHRRLGSLWPQADLHYFRTRDGLKVDFILSVGRKLWAIEVKSSTDISRGATTGVVQFAERTPNVERRIVVFLGSRKQLVDGVEVLPLAAFLDELPG
jgi:predicted AAA+ superfamily ATPase